MILENYLFLDIEASSLNQRVSYPIQIGVATPTMSLSSEQFLIRPHEEWTDWSDQSQEIHGIERDRCVAEGIEVADAVERLRGMVAGKRVFSDVPEWDGFWLRRLLHAADARIELVLEDTMSAYADAIKASGRADGIKLYAQCSEWASRAYPHTHKADEDARHQAATMRGILDEEFRRHLREEYERLAPRQGHRN